MSLTTRDVTLVHAQRTTLLVNLHTTISYMRQKTLTMPGYNNSLNKSYNSSIYYLDRDIGTS
jgi:hypothetical protein